jgi:hypothetical protein
MNRVMKGWVRELRLLADVVADPAAAFRCIRAGAPVGRVLVVLGTLQAALVLVQGWCVLPAVLADPLLQESADPAGSVRRFWIARIVAALLGPGANAARAVALATVLQGCAVLCGVVLPWRVLVSLALHLDVVFWIENLCVTVVLAVHPPQAIEQLEALRLRAGLDLVWHPVSASLARWLAAANLFTLWWALLAGGALVAWMRGHRRSAVAVSVCLWLGLVGLRWMTTSG